MERRESESALSLCVSIGVDLSVGGVSRHRRAAAKTGLLRRFDVDVSGARKKRSRPLYLKERRRHESVVYEGEDKRQAARVRQKTLGVWVWRRAAGNHLYPASGSLRA